MMSRFRQRPQLRPIPTPTRADCGAMLEAYEWDFVIHLTTESPTFESVIARRFINQFVRGLAQSVRQPVPYFYAIERRSSGVPHLHGLIAGAQRLTVEEVQARWHGGFSRVQRYDPSRGAAHYITKSLLDDETAWNLSRRMPPRRVRVA